MQTHQGKLLLKCQDNVLTERSYSVPTEVTLKHDYKHDYSCVYNHDGMKIDQFVYQGKTRQQDATHARATSYGKMSGENHLHLPHPVKRTEELVDIKVKGTVSQIAATLRDGLGPIPPDLETHSRFCVAEVNNLHIRFTCGTFQTGDLSAVGGSSCNVEEVLHDPALASLVASSAGSSAFASSSSTGDYTAD